MQQQSIPAFTPVSLAPAVSFAAAGAFGAASVPAGAGDFEQPATSATAQIAAVTRQYVRRSMSMSVPLFRKREECKDA